MMALGRILEMSLPEFEEEVRRELDENPALEVVADPDTTYSDNSPDPDIAGTTYSDDDRYTYSHTSSASGEGIDPGLMAVDEGDSMTEVLMNRLAADMELSDADTAIARNIIGNLDSNGYLTRALEDIPADVALSDGITVTDADVERIFVAIRHLDPAGICAEDLRDCLLLQLERKTPTQAVDDAITILDSHFRLFTLKHFDRLMSAAGLSRERLTAALDEIRALNPRPAASLEPPRPSDRTAHIVPDLILTYDAASDRFSLSLAGRVPELAVASSFIAMTDSDAPDADNSDDMPQADTPEAARGRAMARDHRRKAMAFARRRRDDAASFIHLMELRAETLMTIAKAIVRLQHAFFVSGDRSDIRPMVLRDVAAATGLDISVVSRAVAGKYIATAHGIYPLKMFFNEAPDGDASTHQVLETLEGIISAEDKSHPLSDRELADALAAAGMDIARRTVAKYRERLGYPVARLRREL